MPLLKSAVPEGSATIEPPLTIIERGWTRRFLDWREFWVFRELLYFLTWRDVKVRYKQTILGALWAIIQPLAMMLVFTLFLGRLAAPAATGAAPYPLFVVTGLLPWTFFAGAIAAAGQSVVGNQSLVTKIYFPRLFIPMGAIGAGLVDLAISFGLLLVMMAYYGVAPGWKMLLVPALTAGLVVTALGVGSLLSALTVAYRDFRHIVPFMVQFWMFATPSIYAQADTIIGPRARRLLPLNPVYGLIINFRAAILSQPFDLRALGLSVGVALGLFFLGLWYFRHVERTFADII